MGITRRDTISAFTPIHAEVGAPDEFGSNKIHATWSRTSAVLYNTESTGRFDLASIMPSEILHPHRPPTNSAVGAETRSQSSGLATPRRHRRA